MVRSNPGRKRVGPLFVFASDKIENDPNFSTAISGSSAYEKILLRDMLQNKIK